ncbi:MAG: histidine kinase [Prolixibacteraceae bacterium]
MTKKNSHIKPVRIFKHAVFWFIWIAGFTVIQSFGYERGIYFAWLVYYLVTLPVFIVHTYIISYWLIPKYFFSHRFFLFSVWIFFLLMFASVGELVVSNEIVWRWVKPEYIQAGNYLNGPNILINGLGNEYIIIVFLSVKVVRYWNSKMSEKSELYNQKLSTEIELLHYQSYPRFVLSVMTRLENLAMEKSPQTSEMIIRLANLMNHMISIQNTGKIKLQKEVELIRSYIDIHRMVFPKGFDVNLLVSDKLNTILIPPFLFFQLVEEGFMVLHEPPDKTDFTILIKAESNYLLFSMTIWETDVLCKSFNPAAIESCKKYLSYFYPDNHKFMSDIELNFVELTIEIYL